MVIDSYVDQIVRSVKFQDENKARQQVVDILHAFAESIEDSYGIVMSDRTLIFEPLASPNRIKL